MRTAAAILLAAPPLIVTLVLTVGSAQTVPQQNQPISQPAPPAPAGDIAAIEARLRAALQQDARQAAIEASTPVLEAGRRDQETAKLVLDVMKNWIAVVTLLFAFLLFIGWREYGAVKRTKDETSKAADEAKQSVRDARDATNDAEQAGLRVRHAESEVALATERVRAIDISIAQSVKDLAQYFDALPKLEKRGVLQSIVGDAPELPAGEQVARYEEADTLITIADKSNSLPKAELVEPLIRLSAYWRVVGNYPRALARLTRAIEIAPDSALAHRDLCGVLYVLASQRGARETVRQRLLKQALDELAKARELSPEEPLLFFDEGWILDEVGDYENAEKAYKRGQALAPMNRNMTYNLACTFARHQKFSEALNELAKIVMHEWEDAEVDSDFKTLTEDPEFGPRFRALIEDGRRGAS